MPLNRDHDYTTRAGAESLATCIRSYWLQRGRVCRVRVVHNPLGKANGADNWVVRSDMMGGWP